MPEEEANKQGKGKPKEEVVELHEAIERMIVRAKPAGLEPPTPQPVKKVSTQTAEDQK